MMPKQKLAESSAGPLEVSNMAHTVAKRAALIFWVAITVIPIIGIILSIFDPLSFYGTQAEAQDFAQRFGAWGPLVFILIQAVQVVVTPISHYSLGYMGGFLYGSVWGTIYNYIGRLIGHLAAYFIAVRFAEPLVRKWVPASTLDRYQHVVSKRADMMLVMYLLPLFPDDELSYMAGLGRMPFRSFLVANLFGQLGGSLGLAYIGSGINTKDAVFWVLLIMVVSGYPLLWFLGRRSKVKSAEPRLPSEAQHHEVSGNAEPDRNK